MELYATHTCQRKDFGRHPQFADEPAELVSDMAPQPDVLATEYIEKSPCVTTVQIAPEMSEHEVRERARAPRPACSPPPAAAARRPPPAATRRRPTDYIYKLPIVRSQRLLLVYYRNLARLKILVGS